MFCKKIKYLDEIVIFAEKYFIFAFALLFYTSWIYEVVALDKESVVIISTAKNVIILAFMLLMVCVISWKRVTLDLFSICVAIWIVLSAVFWFAYPGADHLYLRRIGQGVFTYLFVTYLRQKPENNPLTGGVLSRWFPPKTVMAGVAAIIVLNLLNILSEDVLRGFGNSRVNFSIWLMQLVAMMFLLRPQLNVKSGMFEAMGLLLLITPVYVLQNMTGGRSGMLGTVLIAAYFSYRQAGYRALIFSIFWMYLVSAAVVQYSPLITPENNLNVFRNMPVPNSFSLKNIVSLENLASFEIAVFIGNMIVLLDQLSSYRVSIMVTAFGNLDFNGYLFGVGAGNFMGWAPTYPELGMMEVHNVFLKILGEYGVLGFLTILLWLVPPVLKRAEGGAQLTAKYLQLVYFVVAMVHPDLMVTAINTSLIYLASLATCLAPPESKNQESRNTGDAVSVKVWA